MTLYQPIAYATAIKDSDASNYHRNWLLVDNADSLLDNNKLAKLSDLDISIKFGYLVIRADGMLRLDIPLDVIEDDTSVERTAMVGGQPVRVVDEGDLASAWFTQWSGTDCKLVKVHPEASAVNWPE